MTALAATARMSPGGKVVYWHRDLPPLDAEVIGEHTLEAASSRVPGTLAHRDELWDRCYRISWFTPARGSGRK